MNPLPVLEVILLIEQLGGWPNVEVLCPAKNPLQSVDYMEWIPINNKLSYAAICNPERGPHWAVYGVRARVDLDAPV